jgi:hypothetical protein
VSARQIAESHISDAIAHEPLHIVANLVKHAPDLAIDSLTQHNAHTGRSDLLQSRNLRAFAVEKNSALQFWRQRRVPQVIERRFVFFFDFVTRMGEPLREIAVVGEED